MNIPQDIMLIRMVMDCVGILVIVLLLHVIIYNFRKYMLEKWISKAVNAANKMATPSGYSNDSVLEKKTWVLKFLKDNGLTTGVSDSVVNSLIDAEVNTLKLQRYQ